MLKKPLSNSTLKLLITSFLIITLIFLAQYVNIPVILNHSILWVQSLGALGPIAYIVIYNLATILFIPGSLLTLKGGCLFGLLWGSIYVLIAAIIGAISAFIVGRYLSRDWVSQQINKYPKFKAIDLAVAKEGWKIVLLTRLCPIFPFNLLNYAFGVTQVSLRDYILGSFGIIPGTVLYVYIGSLAGNLAMLNSPNQPTNPKAQIWQWVMQIIGLIATIGITIYMTKIAQKALKESITESEIIQNKTNN
ncbi:TVP38/TMEM64 family protein [Nodularia harveyana UHCC-0300]|uniref:TVP38/TMEM64 family membrane protein n=1 Tax=Nodularia harveyana UHCC-0300 TaxID=2974287 RepID=A0ABU5UJC9_9CYAN|nr:TVP38/TMEM64 family protein [Nodularia harveyana]MEA5583185.1 TVP38/TMEM64 family protein [Nodularia harveyana UHCC-0300]